MLARLFVIFGGLIVLALTAALVGPYFVDWTGYRADFEREASAVLGRKVTVEGEAEARLLPFPSVTFSDVSVGGGPGGEPAMTIEEFSMDAELAPFIRGEVLIFDMRMVRPRATIEIADDGSVDWAVRPSAPFDAAQISLEKLTVTEGQVAIRHAASGRDHLVSEINAEISAKSLKGPWRLGGNLRLDGVQTAFSASTGAVGADGSMPLRVTADPAPYRFKMEADGSIRFKEGTPAYAGTFSARGQQNAAAAQRPEQPPGFRLDGKFSLDHERLTVDEFLLATGPLDNPYSAEGTAFVELGAEPRFSVSADGAQMRFDEAMGDETQGSMSFSDRLAALEAALAELPKPNIPGVVEVNLPAVMAGDSTIREVQLSAEPADGGWKVNSLRALLPGRTTLEAAGKLGTDGQLGFSGSLLLAVGQPSGFAAWLSKDVDDAIRKLPAAGFSAEVELTERRQSFANLELALGNATFRGEAESLQPRNARASSVLRLEGGALDIDGMAAFASLFVSDRGENRFAERDLDFRIKAGPVSAGGLEAETVDASLRLRGGSLEIDRLSVGGLEGASVSATGSVAGFPAKPVGSLDASVVAVDLAPLIRAVAERFPGNEAARALNSRADSYPGLFEDARIDLVATSAANDDGSTGMAASVRGNFGGSDVSATMSASGTVETAADAKMSLTFSARNDDATALLALYGLPALPLGVIGGGETALSVEGNLSEGLETSASLTGEGFLATFEGTARPGSGAPTATGKVALETSDLEPWLMTTGVALPGMGMGLPVGLNAEADLRDGRLALAGLQGTVNEDAVSGDLSATISDGKPHLTGALTLDHLDLYPFAGMVVGEAALAGGGDSGWPSVPFSPQVEAPLSADVKVAAGSLSAGPAVSAHDASLALRLDGEGLRISDLSARIYGGELSGLFELKNSGGTALFSAQAKLTGADLDRAPGAHGLSGAGDFSTAVSASGKSVGGLVAALSGSGTAALRSLAISGVNPGAFAGFIDEADRIGRDIDAAKTAGFAPDIAAAGVFEAAPAEIAFTVAGGVLRAPPVTFVNPAASLEADIQIDLNTSEVSAGATIAYEPGIEELVGSEPVLRFRLEGPLGDVTRSFDTEPLAQFLTQRALEIEQARVEAMQAALLEKQRLRREVRYYAALQDERERAREEMRRLQEEARQRAEAEAKAAQEARERQAREDAEQRARLEADRQARLEAERQARIEEERMAAREAERRRAEEAERLAEEARREAEAQARRPAPEIRRAPLPAPLQPSQADEPAARVQPKPFQPFSIEGFLESLQNTQ